MMPVYVLNVMVMKYDLTSRHSQSVHGHRSTCTHIIAGIRSDDSILFILRTFYVTRLMHVIDFSVPLFECRIKQAPLWSPSFII